MADLSKLADDLSRLTVLEAAELAGLLEEKWQSPQARQSKLPFAAIKDDLPAWPDEVIKEWLLYLANRDDTGCRRLTRSGITHGPSYSDTDRFDGGEKLPGSSN